MALASLFRLNALKSTALPSLAALRARFPDLPRVALSIRQPWSFFIVHGFKPIENRTWRTHFRGPVLIHAGGKLAPIYDEERDFIADALGKPFPRELTTAHAPTGGIVGVCAVVDCVEDHRSPWFVGPFGFVLANARPLPFVALPGKLGFFAVE